MGRSRVVISTAGGVPLRGGGAGSRNGRRASATSAAVEAYGVGASEAVLDRDAKAPDPPVVDGRPA
ncbi:hypothetical protein ACIHCQ_07930 [Streptomyces sp. NPDC052236]|uniref:hypothetical protein n=1 Tax=Streptomyces sp. NPDC052236 TaxID=3365686 RepID=UPI0037D0562A